MREFIILFEDSFEHIDTIFAERVLEANKDGLDAKYALAYLMAACREGHHCISVYKDKLIPSPQMLFPKILEPFALSSAVIEAFNKLPHSCCQPVADRLNLKPVVKYENHYYLQKLFVLEQKILLDTVRLLRSEVFPAFAKEECSSKISSFHDALNSKQQEAILLSLQKPITALTGGPGTGKSYTIYYLLKTFINLCLEQEIKPRILITAPTGKAVSLLKLKIMEELDLKEVFFHAGTMHSALQIKNREGLRKDHPSLPYHLIVVDESSMIDLNVWQAFISSVPDGCRVVFVGDHNQLPPVESAMLFEQLLRILPTTQLEKSMRTDKKDLLNLAEAIIDGEEEKIFSILEGDQISFIEYAEEEDVFNIPCIRQLLEEKKQNWCILSPVLQGNWGVEELNKNIYDFYADQNCQKDVFEVPIIITKTSYAQELYNGDQGTLYLHKKDKEKNYAHFINDKIVPMGLLPPYSFAYALSIHKSQGSEYDRVVTLLPEGAQYFGREALYTAITRARKHITIIAKKGVLLKTLQGEAKRNTVIAERILINLNNYLEQK